MLTRVSNGQILKHLRVPVRFLDATGFPWFADRGTGLLNRFLLNQDQSLRALSQGKGRKSPLNEGSPPAPLSACAPVLSASDPKVTVLQILNPRVPAWLVDRSP